MTRLADCRPAMQELGVKTGGVQMSAEQFNEWMFFQEYEGEVKFKRFQRNMILAITVPDQYYQWAGCLAHSLSAPLLFPGVCPALYALPVPG